MSLYRNDIIKRFWKYVDVKIGDCWSWNGACRDRGYGVYWSGERYLLAHRFALSLVDGKLPSSDVLCLHSCDNPNCVNPEHLRWGNLSDNMLDAVARNKSVRERLLRYNESKKKLSNEDIHAIRLWREVGFGSRTLGRAFGVCPQYIRQILSGKRRRHDSC